MDTAVIAYSTAMIVMFALLILFAILYDKTGWRWSEDAMWVSGIGVAIMSLFLVGSITGA